MEGRLFLRAAGPSVEGGLHMLLDVSVVAYNNAGRFVPLSYPLKLIDRLFGLRFQFLVLKERQLSFVEPSQYTEPTALWLCFDRLSAPPEESPLLRIEEFL